MSLTSDHLNKTSASTPDDHDCRYIYGSAYCDQFLLQDPASFPRYGHLARKALLHYVGHRYNPHLHGLTVEPFLREIIKEIISYKVLHKTLCYDWEWIDHTLRKYIGGCLNIELAYSQCRIDAGFKDAAKAARLINWSVVN